MWRLLDTGKNSAKKNMEIDAQLLKELQADDSPLLHFYDWEEKSVTYGYFSSPEKFLNMEAVQRAQLELARRPTGGGILFHPFDLTFSVLVPAQSSYFSLRALESYERINGAVKRAIKPLIHSKEVDPSLLPIESKEIAPEARHFCMAKPTKYDVMIGSRKVAGAAQRRSKGGYLHQGSILITSDNLFLREMLLPESAILRAMELSSFPLFPSASPKEVVDIKKELKKRLIEELIQGEKK